MTITLLVLNLLVVGYCALMLHRGLKVTIQLPDTLVRPEQPSPSFHHPPLKFFICNGGGRMRTEVNSVALAEFPREYSYGGKTYERYRIYQDRRTAEYRPKAK